MQEPAVPGGELSSALTGWAGGEVPAPLVAVLPLLSLSNNPAPEAGAAPQSAAVCSTWEPWLTVQPMKVQTQKKAFSHLYF